MDILRECIFNEDFFVVLHNHEFASNNIEGSIDFEYEDDYVSLVFGNLNATSFSFEGIEDTYITNRHGVLCTNYSQKTSHEIFSRRYI